MIAFSFAVQSHSLRLSRYASLFIAFNAPSLIASALLTLDGGCLSVLETVVRDVFKLKACTPELVELDNLPTPKSIRRPPDSEKQRKTRARTLKKKLHQISILELKARDVCTFGSRGIFNVLQIPLDPDQQRKIGLRDDIEEELKALNLFGDVEMKSPPPSPPKLNSSPPSTPVVKKDPEPEPEVEVTVQEKYSVTPKTKRSRKKPVKSAFDVVKPMPKSTPVTPVSKHWGGKPASPSFSLMDIQVVSFVFNFYSLFFY